MLIACDGGAFQPGASVGIRGCTIGLLNAAAQIDPSFRAVLVADPRLGEIPGEAVDSLLLKPEIIYAEVAPGSDPPLRGLLTDNPDIRFLVDDISVSAQRETGWAGYEGPPPQRRFIIASRTARPCDVSDSADMRQLGVAVERITIDDRQHPPRVIEHGDPQLQEGFYRGEAAWRWTTGQAVLPLWLFPEATTVRVGVRLGPGHRYRVGGSFDRAFNRVEAALRERARRLALSRLSSELTARGAQTYLANYYLPIVIPGLKLAAWAYDGEPPTAPGGNAAGAFQANADVFRHADCVFSIAERMSRDLVAELGVPAERIVATGIDIAGEHPVGTADAIVRVRRQHGIVGDYILCVGMLEPRQSHRRLVEAYDRLVAATAGNPGAAPPDMMIVGQPGCGYQPVLREIEERGLQQRVKVLAGLEPEDLSALYSDALFVAYPSLYEGFRPTSLDALAYRKPIMTARNSIMSEIAGDAGLLVDFEDVASIVDGLTQLSRDAKLRAELVRRGDARRHAGSWQSIAHIVLDRLAALAGQ